MENPRAVRELANRRLTASEIRLIQPMLLRALATSLHLNAAG